MRWGFMCAYSIGTYPLWKDVPLAVAVAIIWCGPRVRLPRTLKVSVRVPPADIMMVRDIESAIKPCGTDRVTLTGVESTYAERRLTLMSWLNGTCVRVISTA